MGAIAHTNGTTFRVWAPYAEQVLVTGSFNDWSIHRHRLAREENGFWSLNVRLAAPGDEYKFIIHNGQHTLTRTDPYAREVTQPLSKQRCPQRPF